MLLSGILSITNPNSPITFIAYGLTAISVFFGFVYFKIWPLTQTEIEEWIKQS